MSAAYFITGTDTDVGAGDEIGCAHKGFSKTAYTT